MLKIVIISIRIEMPEPSSKFHLIFLLPIHMLTQTQSLVSLMTSGIIPETDNQRHQFSSKNSCLWEESMTELSLPLITPKQYKQFYCQKNGIKKVNG